MKMLKKLAALILAGAMVLVLFTACGSEPTPTQEQQAENQAMSAINATRSEEQKLTNNPQRRAVASQSIDEAASSELNSVLNFFGYSSKVWIKTDGSKDGKYGVTLVTTFDYDGTKLDKLIQKITTGGSLGNADIEQSTKWSEVGVVVKNVKGQTYIAISVAVDAHPDK